MWAQTVMQCALVARGSHSSVITVTAVSVAVTLAAAIRRVAETMY